MATPTQIRRRGRFSLILGTLVAALMVVAVAYADDIVNDLDNSIDDTREAMPLTAGGATGSTVISVDETNGDGKNGCNIQGAGTSVTFSVTSSNTSVATVSPNSITFNNCGDTHTVTVTPLAEGEANITFAQTANTTAGSWNPLPANFKAVVAAASGGGGNNAPSVDAGGPYSGGEGSDIALDGGSASDADGPGPLTYLWTIDGTPSVGTGTCSLTNATSLTGATLKCTDNGSATVKLTATEAGAGGKSGSDTATVTINNVAPTMGSITGPANVITGANVTYEVSATDPSSVDTSAGFFWAWDPGTGTFGAYTATKSASPNSTVISFSTCGSYTIRAKAKDKDNGEADPAASRTVGTYDAAFLSPLRAGAFNMVQKGQVVPVKVNVGCGSSFNSGLSPAIQLLNGELDPNTDTGDPALSVPTESVSSADTTGVMREVDGQYIYNLRVPSGAAGAKYTIRVQPFGAGGGALYVVLQIRK